MSNSGPSPSSSHSFPSTQNRQTPGNQYTGSREAMQYSLYWPSSPSSQWPYNITQIARSPPTAPVEPRFAQAHAYTLSEILRYQQQQEIKRMHAEEYKRQVQDLRMTLGVRQNISQPNPATNATQSADTQFAGPAWGNKTARDCLTASILGGLTEDELNDPTFLEKQRQAFERYSNNRSTLDTQLYPELPPSLPTPPQKHYYAPTVTNTENVANPLPDDFREDYELMLRVEKAQEFVRAARAWRHMDSSLWQLRFVFNRSDLPSERFVSAFVSSKGKREPLENPLDSDWLLVPDRTHTLGESLLVSQRISALSQSTLLTQSLLPPQITKSREIIPILFTDKVDLNVLRSFCQGYGIPKSVRAVVWQLLLEYLPTDTKSQATRLVERRQQYYSLVEQFFPLDAIHTTKPSEREALGLVMVDAPRTHPDNFHQLFQLPCVQQSLERILYVWARKNPRVSYYQGLNDLAAVLLVVFLDCVLPAIADSDLSPNPNEEQRSLWDVESLDRVQKALYAVEPDVYHCLSLILQQVEKYFSFSPGGVYAEPMIKELEKLYEQINPALCQHFRQAGLEFMHFSFRWMLCLFTRELNTRNLVCLWDAYIAEGGSGFTELHLMVCAAYLEELAPSLAQRDMMGMLHILQKAPTAHYTKHDVHRLLFRAFELQLHKPLKLAPRSGVEYSALLSSLSQ